jgi:integrase
VSVRLVRKAPDGLYVFALYTRFEGETHRKRVVTTKTAIDGIYREWIDRIQSHATAKSLTLHEVIDRHLVWCAEHRPAHHTDHMRRYLAWLKAYFNKEVAIDRLKRSKMLDFVEWKRKRPDAHGGGKGKAQLSDGTLLRCVGALNGFFNWALDNELFRGVNPCHRLKLKDRGKGKRQVFLTTDEMREILEAAHLPHHRTLLLVLMTTGMRRGEALKLRWEHVNLESRVIDLPAGITKAGRSRTIPIPVVLAEHLAGLKRECEFVVHQHGQQLSWVKTFWRGLKKRLTFEKARNLTLHGLRHNYTSWLAKSGADPYAIRDWLGHRDLRMTQHYDHYRTGSQGSEKLEVFTKMLEGKEKAQGE